MTSIGCRIANSDAWLAQSRPASPPFKEGAGGGSARDVRANYQPTDPPPIPPFQGEVQAIHLTSSDLDDLIPRQMRVRASAGQVHYALVTRAHADAARHCAPIPPDPGTDRSLAIETAP